MKKIFLMGTLFLLFISCVSAQAQGTRRMRMLQQYTKQTASNAAAVEKFFEMVQKGQTEQIAQLQDVSLLSEKDKFGNNCFHLAKNASTLQALAGVIRRQNPSAMENLLTKLRNERNEMGETPLMAHISYGKADTFFLLYRGSELEMNIRSVQAVDKGGALSQTAEIRKGVVIALSKDMSGRTVAQAALVNANKPGMDRVIRFFKTHAPYLF